ncbi:hypothetical protein K9M79_02990 [Candidatus Woesearchaeota archaeon]|nr:hypothetical protein [Candidatus Woesearchaeota archaeon]
MKKLKEYRVVKAIRNYITPYEARLDEFWIIKQKARTFFGKLIWVDFKVEFKCGDYSWMKTPEFKDRESAEKYLEGLKTLI